MHFDPNQDREKDLFHDFSPDFSEPQNGFDESAPLFPDDDFLTGSSADSEFDFSEFDHPAQYPAPTEDTPVFPAENTDIPEQASEPAQQESLDFQPGEQDVQPGEQDFQTAELDFPASERDIQPEEQDLPMGDQESQIPEGDGLTELPSETEPETKQEAAPPDNDPDLTKIMEEFSGETPQQTPAPPKKKKRSIGVPIVAQWLRTLPNLLEDVGLTLASLSRLRIQCCHRLWRRSQMQLESYVAVAVA